MADPLAPGSGQVQRADAAVVMARLWWAAAGALAIGGIALGVQTGTALLAPVGMALAGWLTKKWQIVPVSRIQTIDTEIGLIQRYLGLATITVTTASSEGKITIEGLDARLAEETVHRLREVAAATRGDAT